MQDAEAVYQASDLRWGDFARAEHTNRLRFFLSRLILAQEHSVWRMSGKHSKRVYFLEHSKLVYFQEHSKLEHSVWTFLHIKTIAYYFLILW